MSFIKIGCNNEGEMLCVLCSGAPDSSGFFHVNKEGVCEEAREPIIIEFNQDNLKKMAEVFTDEKTKHNQSN